MDITRVRMQKHAKIIENLGKILKYYVIIDRISKQRDSNIEIDNETIALDLKFFYDQNYEKMHTLLEDTKKGIKNSKDLNVKEQEKFNQILGLFTWLVSEYYSPNKPEENLREIWNTNYRKVTKNRSQVDELLEMTI